MNEFNKLKYTIGDYELIDDLIDQAKDNMDRDKMNRLTIIKNKIYADLVADGLQDELISVISKKWDIVEIGIDNGVKRFNIKRKGV